MTASHDVLEGLRADRHRFEQRWVYASCLITVAACAVLALTGPEVSENLAMYVSYGICATFATAGIAWMRWVGSARVPVLLIAAASAIGIATIHVYIDAGDTAVFYALPAALMALLLLQRRDVLSVLALFIVVLSASSVWRDVPDPHLWSHRVDAILVLASGSVLALLHRGRFEREARQLTESLTTLQASRNAERDSSRRAAEALALAEEANASQRRFLASMSHELRTPLNAILGYTEMVCDELPVDSEEALDLQRVLSAGGHLLELIDDVLDLARIEAGGRSLVLEKLDLVTLAREALDWTRARVRSDQSFELDAPEQLPIVSDRTIVRQILLNLLGNAVRHAVDAHVVVHLELDQGGVRIGVSDDGPGISVADQQRIFEPFQRGEGATERAPGAGLGLALVARFADRLGGTIELWSIPGCGARFDVQLPAGGPPSGRSGRLTTAEAHSRSDRGPSPAPA